MKRDETAYIAAALIIEGYPRLMRDFAPDSCIAAARMVIQVARGLGLSAAAVPVKVVIYSPELTRRCEASLRDAGRWPSIEDVTAWLDARDVTKCHSILLGSSEAEAAAMGAPREPTRYHDRGLWSGHLAVLLNDQVLLDLTLPQACRGDVEIELEPTALTLTSAAAFLAGDERATRIVNGSMCQWSASDARGWETAPDWREKFRTRDLAKEVRRAIERRVRHA